MTTIQVFDRPMCCSTGVCGPSMDPSLPRFAADLDWLKAQGVAVERYNLAHQPAAFAGQPDIREVLQRQGMHALPIIRVNGRIVSKGVYPSRDLLAGWTGLIAHQSLPLSQECGCSPEGCC
jgi:arsenite methyltransferase